MNKQNKYYDDYNIYNFKALKLKHAVKQIKEQLYADTTCTDTGT